MAPKKLSTDFDFQFVFQELSEYVNNGTLKMRTAFSRDQPDKVYVTNLLREDADLIWQVIDNKGHVYICG